MMVEEQEEERTGGDGGKIEWKLSEAVSRGQNELTSKFKMAVSDVINVRG
jgi:hypothetical protein